MNFNKHVKYESLMTDKTEKPCDNADCEGCKEGRNAYLSHAADNMDTLVAILKNVCQNPFDAYTLGYLVCKYLENAVYIRCKESSREGDLHFAQEFFSKIRELVDKHIADAAAAATLEHEEKPNTAILGHVQKAKA